VRQGRGKVKLIGEADAVAPKDFINKIPFISGVYVAFLQSLQMP
jgi:hypothetical protein